MDGDGLSGISKSESVKAERQPVDQQHQQGCLSESCYVSRGCSWLQVRDCVMRYCTCINNVPGIDL